MASKLAMLAGKNIEPKLLAHNWILGDKPVSKRVKIILALENEVLGQKIGASGWF